jgi:argininosuccinate synthase
LLVFQLRSPDPPLASERANVWIITLAVQGVSNGRQERQGQGEKGRCSPIRAGLDTSIILKWLQETYQAEVVTFTADLGQGEELEPARRKAEMLGIKKGNIFIEDLREEFVPRLRVPDVPRQRALRGRLPARHLDRPAADRQEADRDRAQDRRRRRLSRRHRQGQRPGALRAQLLCAGAVHQDHRARGASGPSRAASELIDFAEQHQIPIAKDKRGEAPFSVDANLLHSSSEGKVLEDPAVGAAVLRLSSAPSRRWRRPTRRPTSAIGFAKGDPRASTARSCLPPPC